MAERLLSDESKQKRRGIASKGLEEDPFTATPRRFVLNHSYNSRSLGHRLKPLAVFMMRGKEMRIYSAKAWFCFAKRPSSEDLSVFSQRPSPCL